MSRALVGLVVGLVLALSSQAQSVMYGSAFTGGGPSTLYRVDPNSGAAVPIGPIGVNGVGSLAWSYDGHLYGVGSVGGVANLIIIDPNTGVGTVIGPTGVGNFQDIEFNNNGTLYGFAAGNIYTFNLTTGAATLVGATGFGFPDGNGLAFVRGTLYNANNANLLSINPVTGAGTLVAPMTFGPGFTPANTPRPPGMKYDPQTGTVYATVFENFPAAVTFLAKVDVATGNVTMVGNTVLGMDALAVAFANGVPTLSDAWIAALAILLAMVAFAALRHRRN